MDTGLQGKVAVVTGASRGIGEATAHALAAEGCSVVLVSRNQEALDAVADAITSAHPLSRAIAVAAHVARPGEAERVAGRVEDELGRLDVLVNNAGTNPHFGPLLDIDRERAEKTVATNQWAPVHWVQACAPLLVEGGGSVVNLASIGGLVSELGIGWYNATKAALIHLTRQLAMEMGPSVRVNGVAPGLVRTDLARALWEPAEDAIAGALPMRRIGEPADVANAIVFLAGEAASWITGQTLIVDGGTVVRPSIA
jgi:NAD(P)-dependent dehydrogenase (short-subunit alcohol dehydrogenase family)